MRNRNASLVVIEYGASWPRWLHPAYSGDLSVIAQHYDGPPSSLLTQVEARVGRLMAAGWQLDAVVLVSNGRADSEAMASRTLLGRGLMAHLRGAGGAHFTLSVDEALGRRAAHALTALAASLDPTAAACGMSLSVRLGEKPALYQRAPLAAVG